MLSGDIGTTGQTGPQRRIYRLKEPTSINSYTESDYDVLTFR